MHFDTSCTRACACVKEKLDLSMHSYDGDPDGGPMNFVFKLMILENLKPVKMQYFLGLIVIELRLTLNSFFAQFAKLLLVSIGNT